MNRRQFLGGVAGGGLAGLAGCNALRNDGGGTPTAATATTDGLAQSLADVELPVPKEELNKSAPKDGIAAITEPAFADDWSDVAIDLKPNDSEETRYRPRLDSDEKIIGVSRDGESRAYPLKVLDWHEVVNDEFGDALLVTYCPLCRSGVTARRTVDGRETVFGVSGYLWHSDLVMYDRRTDSLWSQILATAVRGEETGETLELVPSTLTTLGSWRESYPDTKVLLPPPLSNTVLGRLRFNYDFDIYERRERIWDRFPRREGGFGDENFGESGAGLRRRTTVVGVRADGVARAYPLQEVRFEGVVNDIVGGLPVVVAVVPDDTLVAYVRRAAGTTLTFSTAAGSYVTAGGSRWEITTGRAIDGPYEGVALEPANERSPMTWFAWLAFNPETEVYRSGGA